MRTSLSTALGAPHRRGTHPSRDVRRAAAYVIRPTGRGILRAVTDTPARIRVLLVDDHAVVRRGLRGFLELQDDIEVVGEARGRHPGRRARAAASARRHPHGPADAEMDGSTRSPPSSSPAGDRDRGGHLVHRGGEGHLGAGGRASGYLLKDAEAEEVADRDPRARSPARCTSIRPSRACSRSGCAPGRKRSRSSRSPRARRRCSPSWRRAPRTRRSRTSSTSRSGPRGTHV